MAKPVTVRPMLAVSTPVNPEDVDLTNGPVWVSPKIDGIRCLQMKSISTSRTLKPIASQRVQRELADPMCDGLDGELCVGPPNADDCINQSTSGINSANKEAEFTYYVFDLWDCPDVGFATRNARVRRRVAALKKRGFPVEYVPQRLCRTVEEVREAVNENYTQGYEGSIIRSYDGIYKYNRSTLAEGLLLKVKEFEDREAKVVGFIEMQRNNNELTTDERGYAKRSTHKANKVAAGTLGKMEAVDLETGEIIFIGPGKMKATEKLEVWLNQDKYLGKISRYRSATYGVKDKPRFPRHIVWRDETDIGDPK